MSSSQGMSQALRAKIMSADDAAALVKPGSHVGMSGFTGSGYPKAVPLALARRIEAGEAWDAPKFASPTGQAPGPGLEQKSCDAQGGGR